MNISPDIRLRLLERLSKASATGISAEQITETTSLREDLKLDSLEMVTLVFDLQDELGVVIEDEELYSIITVGSLMEIIEAKLAMIQASAKKIV